MKKTKYRGKGRPRKTDGSVPKAIRSKGDKVGRPKKQKHGDRPKGKRVPNSEATQFTKENRPKSTRGPDSLLTRIKDRIYTKERFFRFKGVEVVDSYGRPTGRVVDVRIPLVNADGASLKYTQDMMKESKVMMDFLDRDTGKAVETHKLISDDKDDIGYEIIIK